MRTPYNKGDAITPIWQSFVNYGYAVVVEDVRGRYKSGGKFEPINQEVNDGDDTLNWIARQPWSDGDVGMYGGSYLGIAEWKAALTQNPHLKAIFPYVSGDDDYRDRFYSTGGAMKIGHRLLWLAENMRAPGFVPPDFKSYVSALPVRTADRAATGHPSDDWNARWRTTPPMTSSGKRPASGNISKTFIFPCIRWAAGTTTLWRAISTLFRLRHKRNPDDRIMIGPWAHVFSATFANVNYGKDSLVPLRPEQLRWFDRWLKSGAPEKKDPSADPPPVRIFVMGINQWRDEEDWPLGARTQ